MRLITLLFVTACLASCALPESRVSVGDERPRIAIDGARSGQRLYVDGLEMGKAVNYDGNPNVLLVEKGRHRIEVRDSDGTVVMSEDVYLGGGETRTFSLGSGR